MSSLIPRNLTEIEAITGCTFVCICNTVFRMFSCLQINCQPFYLRQLLKFHQFDWLIEIYLQTEGQSTHHKMVSLQPMSVFSPLFIIHVLSEVMKRKTVNSYCFIITVFQNAKFFYVLLGLFQSSSACAGLASIVQNEDR